ncbi:hypothetical protein CQ13_04410 [Bradyrhizobium retamae]|uniref:Uncharacterized protein n=1 Tax=Bradyrhizobium retamae TaxID=1300035 RepID=A0A0R3NBE6_9BRAD|nr:hypothetical protein CQ13_04410 [Bradyrhizobium retamae]
MGDPGRQFLQANADVAPLYLTRADELIRDRLCGRDGTANPMPTLTPTGEKIAVLTPITSPAALNSGPPELPWLMDASVCRKSSYDPA